MKTFIGFFVLAVAAACGNGVARSSTPPVVQEAAGAQEITFPAQDGQTVYGDLYRSGKEAAKSVVLMFHQAGSNAGEYETIAPQIVKLGTDCLAIDQRSGGNMFDRKNRTATTAKGSEDYMDAYKDMEGALSWAKSQGYKKIIPWGSSYSASLTIKLLSEHPELNAGLAFSPGEYFDDKNLVKSWAANVKATVLIACTPDEAKDGRIMIYQALNHGQPHGVIVYPPGTIHGSSTCIEGKSPAAALMMKSAKDFLKNMLE
ncbi:MAG TPA: hypothetical protein VGL56_08355 [Fimbriimonadaceae bacterium]|jgi:dienelactone hydrolase